MPDKHRGLVFHGARVPGVMSGAVTVTTRVMKKQPLHGIVRHGDEWLPLDEDGSPIGDVKQGIKCPFRVGEIRYVKETWGAPYSDHPRCPDGKKPAPGEKIVYRANPADDCQWSRGQGSFCWRSSMLMPRWAARTWIEILAVRPARCQEITEDEARDSGAKANHAMHWPDDDPGQPQDVYRRNYAVLWNRLNAERGFSWSENCWVWRLHFRLVQP